MNSLNMEEELGRNHLMLCTKADGLAGLHHVSQMLQELSTSVAGIRTSCEDCPVWAVTVTR